MAFCENSFWYWTPVYYWHEKLITIMWDRYKKSKKKKKALVWETHRHKKAVIEVMENMAVWIKQWGVKYVLNVANLEIGIYTKNIWICVKRCPGKGVKMRASCHYLCVHYRSCVSKRKAFRKESILSKNVHRLERIQEILGLLSWKRRLLYLFWGTIWKPAIVEVS